MHDKHARHGVTVMKVGGARLVRRDDLDALARTIRARHDAGRPTVLVHGGGPEISDLHERLGVPFEKIDGLRVTSPEGMTLTTMVLCGAVNTRIVERFVAHGLPALGVSGVDLGLLRAPLAGAAWGRVGGPPQVAAERLEQLLAAGLVPVVAPVSLGPDGAAVNVNADDAAHAIAAALGASALEFVSDIPGVTEDDRVLRRLVPVDVERLIARGVVKGGMVPKLRAAVAALAAGVGRVRIGNLTTIRTNHATEVLATS